MANAIRTAIALAGTSMAMQLIAAIARHRASAPATRSHQQPQHRCSSSSAASQPEAHASAAADVATQQVGTSRWNPRPDQLLEGIAHNQLGAA